MMSDIKSKLRWFPVKDVRSTELYPAWISREDRCACGLRSKPPSSCKPGKHYKKLLFGEEVKCLVSKGFGVVGSKIAVWDGRLLFAAGSTIKKVLLAATLTGAGIQSSQPQKLTALTAAQKPGQLVVPWVSRKGRNLWKVDHPDWDQLDSHYKSIYERPYNEKFLPPEMRSIPLIDILPNLPATQWIEGPPNTLWYQYYEECIMVVMPTFRLCVITPSLKKERQKARFLVAKTSLVFGLLTYNMPLEPNNDKVLIVEIVPGKKTADATLENDWVKIGEDYILDSEYGVEGTLLHELAHVVLRHLPDHIREGLNKLYISNKGKINTTASVILPDRAPPPKDHLTYNYAENKHEFFSTACESWFNAVGAHLLDTDRGIRSLRTTRNRVELFELFPDVAKYLSTFLPPYSYNVKELDGAANDWLLHLPDSDMKMIDTLHNKEVSRIAAIALKKLEKTKERESRRRSFFR